MGSFIQYKNDDVHIKHIPPDKFFSGIATSPNYLFKNAIPRVLKVKVFEGQPGKVGSMMFIDYRKGGARKACVVKIDTINEGERVFGYSVVASTDFNERMTEKISYEITIHVRDRGSGIIGSIAKSTVTHHTKPSVGKPKLEDTQSQGFDAFKEFVEYSTAME